MGHTWGEMPEHEDGNFFLGCAVGIIVTAVAAVLIVLIHAAVTGRLW